MDSALYVMWHRQIKEYFRNKQRLIVSLVQPLLFLIAFGFGLGNSFQSSGNFNYIQYLLPGIVGMTIMMSSTMGGMSLIWDKKFGFLKETLVAPVSRINLLFGRCLGNATTSVFQGLIVLFLGYFMGFRIFNWSMFPLIILCMFFIALLFNLLGTSLAAKFDDMQSFPSIMNFLMMPMMFLSGAFFSTNNFPKVLQFIVKINPFDYCVSLLRFVISGIETNLLLDFMVVGILILLLGFLGTRLFNRMEV
ncbi:ABC transporter permease [archaeon]|nr:ABC transporter permease [archaeon]